MFDLREEAEAERERTGDKFDLFMMHKAGRIR